MALPVTDNLRQQIRLPQVIPSLVIKIDGISTVFGNVSIKRYIKIGDPGLKIGGGWFIGGFSLLDDQAPWIQFNQGTTTKITQKLDPSRGQGSSVSSMTINVVDLLEQVTEIVSPGFKVQDILNRRVTVFLGARESSWPEDYNAIFRGVVADVLAGPGFVELRLNSTDEKKRISVIPPLSARTAAPVNYRSATFQGLFFKNRDDVTNTVQVTYIAGGTAGSEVVSLLSPYHIQVQIADGVSTPQQIKKAIENSADSNQLVEVKTVGDSIGQNIGTTTLGIDSSIDLDDASAFLLPADSGTLRTYVQIGDELIEYTGRTGNTLTGCVRAQNGTLGSFHDVDEEAEQVSRINGNGIDLALKIMLSRGPTNYASAISAKSFVFYTPSISQANTIFFDGIDLVVDYGVAPGDFVTSSGASNANNNFTDQRVIDVGRTRSGSFLVVEGPLDPEPSTAAVLSFKSQYNTLPIGMAMLPNEVDVEQHHFIRDTFLPVFDLDIYTKEFSDGKGFLEKEVYLPMTCFSVPRKGRSSIVYTTGPLPTYEVVTLDLSTVENPDRLKVQRSINENFFNSVFFAYQFDPVEEKFTKTLQLDSTSSTVEAEIKQFSIESKGLRTGSDAEAIADRAARRLLRRYESGAEFIKGVQVLFSAGYRLEIGDVVAVDYAALKLSDFSRGNRQGGIKLMEVLNKTLDNKTGEVSLDLVNTAFQNGDRFGLISPASEVGSGSTTTKIIMRQSFGTRPFEPESLKWLDYIGQDIIVRPADFSSGPYQTTIRGFDTNDPQGMSVDPLPVVPSAGWIIECVEYPSSTDPREQAYWKLRHAFFSPQVEVTAGVSATRFTVASGDVGKFFVGSIVRVHNYAYTIDSPERTVTEIDGNDVIVNGSLGFTPAAGQFVDLIGFPDQQQAYRVV